MDKKFDDISPSKLLKSGQFKHATCGMSRETVSLLRSANQADRGKKQLACQEFANNIAELIGGGVSALVMIAPPVGATSCCAMNSTLSSLSFTSIAEVDIVIWFLLDITDIDSKQTTFLNIRLRNSEQVMRSLYRLAPSGGLIRCGDTFTSITGSAPMTVTIEETIRSDEKDKNMEQGTLENSAIFSSKLVLETSGAEDIVEKKETHHIIHEVVDHSSKCDGGHYESENYQEINDENEDMIAYDHTGRIIDDDELSMLRSVKMLGNVKFVKKSKNKGKGSIGCSDDVSAAFQEANIDPWLPDEIDEWMAKVQQLVNLPQYKAERALPCEIIPGLYLSSAREARSSETLRKHQISHVFSCIDNIMTEKKSSTKARQVCAEANAEFMGIWSVDEIDTDMTEHYQTFKQFADPLLEVNSRQEEQINGGNRILVHCEAGVNRSGLLVVAYVMTSMKLPILKALELCLESRGPLLWNTGFQKQLVTLAREHGLLIS